MQAMIRRASLNVRRQPYYKLALILLSGFLLQSCASYSNHSSLMRDSLLQGKPHLSLALAEQNDLEQVEVLSSLNKGMLRRINNDFSGSNQIFEVAKQKIEQLYGISISENFAALTINETLRGYQGARYEQLLLHAYMAMNYIQLGQLEGARVEMLQANVKMLGWGDEPEENAFLRYLEGIIFESLHELDAALVSYRKAYIAYQEKAGVQYPFSFATPVAIKKDLLRLLAWQELWDEYESYKKKFNKTDYTSEHIRPKARKNMGELVVILNNGLVPVKTEAVIHFYSPEVQKNLRVVFPVYNEAKKRLFIPRIHVNKKQYSMETVQDVDALARYSLAQAIPGIMLRATARAVIKYNNQHAAQKSSDLAGLLMTITNMLTEVADTRSWLTLPQEIQLRRITLPVGEQHVQIKMQNSNGQVIDVIEETVTIESRQSSFLIKHWVAPVVNTPLAKMNGLNTQRKKE